MDFPVPPSDSLQSPEDADSETYYRRAYFTNYTREEVLDHYVEQFDYFPIVRLNYPPEDSQTLIRDQTRSTYLEELVHPLRESIYINGFKPKEAKDEIVFQERKFEQKIIIRYVPSDPKVGLVISTTVAILIVWTIEELKLELPWLKKKVNKSSK
jgi:hypothetical protein